MDGVASNQRHLSDYLALLKRQRVFLLATLVVGIVIGLVALNVMAPTYKSTASVLVEATTDTTQASDARTNGSSVNMDTEAQVVRSLPVANAVREVLGSHLTPAQLASRVQVTIPPNTTILDIGYTAGTAGEAQAGAQAFADEYLAYRTAQAEQKVAAQIKILDQQAADVAAQTQSLNTQLAGLAADSPRRDTAEQTMRGLRTRARWIDEQLLPLETAQTNAGSVLVSAPRPGAPASPNRVLVMGSSIVLMMLLGFSVVWWRDRRQGRIRAGREMEEEHRVPVLGSVADATLGAVGRQGHTRSLQQYRQLVHVIQARLGDGEATVLVSGVGSSPVAGRVAHTLGAAVARTGSQVTLVYPDEETAQYYAGQGSQKFSGRLETTSLEAAELVDDGDVQNRGLGEFLAGRTAEPDRMVLMSTPPMGDSADAQAIAPHVRLTVLVIDLDRSTHDEVADALRQLRQVGASELGALVVTGRRLRGFARLRRRSSRQDSDVAPDPASDPARGRGSNRATKKAARASAKESKKASKEGSRKPPKKPSDSARESAHAARRTGSGTSTDRTTDQAAADARPSFAGSRDQTPGKDDRSGIAGPQGRGSVPAGQPGAAKRG
jgi:capsular polysaccharide biosynthesis protein